MSNFQFNFVINKAEEAKNSNVTIDNDSNIALESNKGFIPCEEWIPPKEFLLKCIDESECEPVEGCSDLVKRKYSNILSEMKSQTENEIIKITKESDLEPNKYEGGLKTWECSIDLLNYLSKEDEGKAERKVLEIGCGSGLPGIFCYKRYETQKDGFVSDEVEDEDDGLFVFQDFNQSVLERVTFPNLLLNSKDPSLLTPERVKFFFGDWKDFPSKLPEGFFNLILTSETIYRQDSYEVLLKIFSHALSHDPSARVLLAAKDYYFGLGGSVQEFCKFVVARGGWNVTILKHFQEGVPRSILELKRTI